MASPASATVNSIETADPKPRKDRPCDACRKRKSRCVINDGAKICVLCDFHHQECTFVQTPQPRKRKLNTDGASSLNGGEDRPNRRWQSSSRSPETESAPRKLSRQSVTTPGATLPPARADKPPVKDYAELKGPSLLKKTLGLQSHRHSCYVGSTTELEPCVIRLATFDRKEEASFAHNTIRRVNERDFFLMQADDSTPDHQDELNDLDTIESIVAPYGQELVNLYFRIVHPSFPILHKRVWLEKYSRTYREFSPPLLAAVYILALNWWSYSSNLSHLLKPDVKMLERVALKAMGNVIQRPKLSTVQAGLLLLQRPESDSWSLTAQLMVIGQALGLHLDCSNWKIPLWEAGLRRRLAWGLYMQDKWGSVIYGRPSQIHDTNWAVKPVSEEDFPENAMDEDEEEGSTEVRKGMILFTQMIMLTRILSEILDTFYSLRAIEEVEFEGRNGTQLILEKAKPIQINLRDWYAGLPDCLRMDSTKVMKLSSTGYLHLAYYATEITLHRCIIRSLSPSHSLSSSLHQICRSAAKARFVSAIDFVYRLRPEHLQSFWYFASKTNLAIVGSFGCLLWVTADSKDEAEFYKGKISEYKWTLRVSSKGVDFMNFAMEIIDASISALVVSEQRARNSTGAGIAAATATARLDGDEILESPHPPHSQSQHTHQHGYHQDDLPLLQPYGNSAGAVHPHPLDLSGVGAYSELNDEYDTQGMDFQDLLGAGPGAARGGEQGQGQSQGQGQGSGTHVQVSPSATISADLSADELDVQNGFYESGDGFEFSEGMGQEMGQGIGHGHGHWMGNTLVDGQWRG